MQADEFVKKFRALNASSPRVFSTTRDSENCLYTEALAYSKNCYYVVLGGWAEDCYCGDFVLKCRDCVDFLKIEGCELCYECVDCYQCYNGDFLLNCNAVRDSQYCFGLKDCTNSFLSSNQHHKSFLFKNEQCIPEEFHARVAEYKKSHSPEELYREFLTRSRDAIRISTNIINSEDCVGDYITDSKSAYWCFDVARGRDYFYSQESGYGHDSCDVLFTGEGELLYECIDVTKKSYNCSFCISCTTCVNFEFCVTCYDSSDCFGCVYIKGGRYMILNTKYGAEAYHQEVTALKKALLNAGVYNLGLLVQ